MRRCVAAVALLVALVPSAYLAWGSRDMPQLGYAHDDGMYWIAAQSLAEGSGYRIASLPGAPYQTKYPPLYPLALSVVWRMQAGFPSNLALAALVAWLWAALYTGIALAAFRDLGIGGWRAVVLAVVLALSPWVALGGISLLSELPFSVLAIAALTLIERARKPMAGPWWAAAAGLAAGMACLTRTAGIVLLAAGPVAFAGRKQWKRAWLYTAAMLPAVAGWLLWAQMHRTGQNDLLSIYYTDYIGYYLRDFSVRGFPLMVWKNLDSLVTSTGGLFVFGLGDSFAGKSIARVLAAAAIAGTIRGTRRTGWNSYHVFAAAYAGLLLVWDFTPDQRFLVPLFPILLAGLWFELENVFRGLIAAWRGGVAGRVTAAAFLTLLAAGLLAAALHTRDAYRRALPQFVAHYRSAAADALPVYRWIGTHLPRGAKLLAYFDTQVYLWTGRRACRYFIVPSVFYHEDRAALEAACHAATRLARAQGASYVLLTPADPEIEVGGERRSAGERLLAANPNWRLLYRSAGGSVYRLE